MGVGKPIWSVGHSNHDLPDLVGLLRGAGVQVVADLRSQPYSRFSPHFNRQALRSALLDSDIQYVFLGEELGGRPPETELYDAEGHVLYGEVAKTERFGSGVQRLLDGAEMFRVAMLCSEEDPSHCHRRLLVTRVLAEQGVPVVHIRGDGSTVTEAELAAEIDDASQGALFAEETSAWRSTRSVSPNTPPKTSLSV